ncbi:putative dienelactone hydrolase [Rhizobium sp. BK650]|uniref:alpha/beta hydrolase family protein n=1 Tax=Rhizobium sp. BK650 TaxID=2586990 RepID=UPI00161745B9|nr:dienelactone hydrolase [Rhizobium sp. BK650]MBB3659670.1 putative dienelactone hydrolase [Rhizobium sp. BK650]
MRLLSFLVAAGLLAASSAFAADPVGTRTIELPAPARRATLQVMVWYPTASVGTLVPSGKDKVFKETPALKGAAIAEGSFPLILISHGSGGSIANLDWLATRLAATGFIVAGPNHPGTTRGDSTPLDTTKLWQRAADLSDVLTALSADPAWAPHIDGKHVGALGFSLGGHTVMAVAGVRVDREAYARYCDEERTMADCVWFSSGTVNLRSADKHLFEQSNRDPRIRSVIAIDPSVVRAFTAESLRSIDIPVHIINIGRPETIPVAVRSDDIAAEIPGAEYQTVDGAVHLSFLAECRPEAPDFLKSIGETDPICEDAPGKPRTRAEIHVQMAAMIEAAFLADFARRE